MIYFKKGTYVLPGGVIDLFRFENHEVIEGDVHPDVVFKKINENQEKKYFFVSFKTYQKLFIAYLRKLLPNANNQVLFKLYCYVYNYFVIYYANSYGVEDIGGGVNEQMTYSEFEKTLLHSQIESTIDIKRDIPLEIMLARYFFNKSYKKELNKVIEVLYLKGIRSEMISYYFGLKFKGKWKDYPAEKKVIIEKIIQSQENIKGIDKEMILTLFKEYWSTFGLKEEPDEFVFPSDFLDAFVKRETRDGVMKFGKLSTMEFNLTVNTYLLSFILDNKDNVEFLENFKW